MLKVGLTGSIAVGKSYVCEVLRELGCFILDADLTARDVVKIGTKGLQLITDEFGVDVLQANGELDRVRLGSIVFADAEKRQLLNSIVHPLVIEAQNEWLAEKEAGNSQKIAVIDAALMIESGGAERFEKLIVVWCDAETQILRLMTRNNLNRDEAILRISAQMSQKKKKSYGDYLIETTDGFESARKQTIEVFERLEILLTKK